jgi:small subunit ribosomal protein S5
MAREFRKREKSKEEFLSNVLDLNRVARMTAGGRKFKFRAIVIVGDQKGRIGLGMAKGTDVSDSVEKATRAAKKNVIHIPIVNDTIAHKTYAKSGAAEILLKPQSKGRGLVAGGTVRVICNLAGIKNISSKVLGRTTNKLSNAMATIEALKKIKQN